MGNNNCGSVFPKIMLDVMCPADVVAVFPPNTGTPEVKATAVLNVTGIPVNQNPPFPFGVTLLNAGRAGAGPGGYEIIAVYVHDADNTTDELVAQGIVAAVTAANNGYSATVDGTQVSIIDKPGFGDAINGSNLSFAHTNALPFVVQISPFAGGADAVVVPDNLQLRFTVPANAGAYKARIFTRDDEKVTYFGLLTPGATEVRTIGINEVVDRDVPHYVELSFFIQSPSPCVHEIG